MAQRILVALGFDDVELSILFVDDAAIQKLNRHYLGRNHPTNVIAFPMREGEFALLSPHLLGDIVVSVETAYRQAKAFSLTRSEALIFLMIHGILHLAGYDHEGSKSGAREMASKERELLGMVRRRFSVRLPTRPPSGGTSQRRKVLSERPKRGRLGASD